jgi:capsular polysaccharide biosynthesis protein
MSASSDSLLSNASAKKSCPIEYKVMFAIVIVMAIVACVAVAVIVSSRSGEAVLSPFRF